MHEKLINILRKIPADCPGRDDFLLEQILATEGNFDEIVLVAAVEAGHLSREEALKPGPAMIDPDQYGYGLMIHSFLLEHRFDSPEMERIYKSFQYTLSNTIT